MFKKLKDKLAEEVKSSPQRIQQFAQAAQAAVTSASSSISDITNSDLFSIGDNDAQNTPATKLPHSLNKHPNTYQDSHLGQITMEPIECTDRDENQRQRKLSNSSFASDISFRLPSYETPSMYHLQSDMEVSASEAEERGFSGSNVSLERVTKEQLYAAYRRTQERYKKYRTQYGDLARHYKLLEKENAKARSVLVETQDKALRRISELREQCALEQSAKAHLEQSLRVEIEEKNMKINALSSENQVLQNNSDTVNIQNIHTDKRPNEGDSELQLINFANENEAKSNELSVTEVSSLNIKIEKMEQLLNKYKESLKTSKDKNTQIINDLQILSNELENKNKEIANLTATVQKLNEDNKKVHELSNKNEELQNKINAYDFAKSKEVSTLEIDLQRARDEIEELQNKINVFTKREEDYAISLAENKLSIHKELENKESEIKTLKDGLSAAKKEIQSLNIVIDEYKSSLTILEEEKSKFNSSIKDYKVAKSKIIDLESTLQETTKKFSQLEQTKSKLDEDYKCLQLQLKQETAEKLAMIDRNVYLENRNMQIREENTKKTAQISSLESELITFKKDKSSENPEIANEIHTELNTWKSKYETLESEIQDERVELVKLQSEIEKLLVNHELIQSQNTEFHNIISVLKSENITLQEQVLHYNKMKNNCNKLLIQVNEIKKLIKSTSDQVTLLKKSNCDNLVSLDQHIKEALNQFINKEIKHMIVKQNELSVTNVSLNNELLTASEENAALLTKLGNIQEEHDIFKSKILNLELQRTTLNENLNSLSKKYEETIQDLEGMRLERETLNYIINEKESKSNSLQASLELEQLKQLDLIDQINLLENEKKTLLQKITSIEETNFTLKSQVEKVQEDCNSEIEEILKSKNIINKDLIEKIDELNIKMFLMNQLQDRIKMLTEENITLEMQAQNIAHNVKDLESEINDVRVSHAAIVIEKDRLSGIIERLENKQKSQTEHETKDTQTEIAIENKTVPAEVTTLEVSEQNDIVQNQIETIANVYKEIEFCNKCVSHKSDYDIMKTENKRLQSDIEGLQTYLTKISKENCVLNDKLRELIATSEHSTENDIINNLRDLKSEIQLGKEKIENLTRENMLLVEENLELKDQLQAQNYTKLPDETDTFSKTENRDDMKEKYDNLIHINNELEQRLHDSEHVNKSVSTNMQQIHEKNEKLKSSNEKLERRLDEALVSLRHLHSLQENTELEYLRNILYEYLTGSGTHSVTLAKVLAAIVKFDDSQTQLVLQKEKERQGFLRQLGII